MASTGNNEQVATWQLNRALEALADADGQQEGGALAEAQVHATIALALFTRDLVIELRNVAGQVEKVDDALRNTVGGQPV